MTRLAGALLAAVVCVAPAHADEIEQWLPPQLSAPASGEWADLDSDPWAHGATIRFPDDAYVFADVLHEAVPSPDAVAAAVRSDVERLARPLRRASMARAPDGRVAFAFERFAPVGQNGGAYASIDGFAGQTRSLPLAAAVSLEQALLAMMSLDR